MSNEEPLPRVINSNLWKVHALEMMCMIHSQLLPSRPRNLFDRTSYLLNKRIQKVTCNGISNYVHKSCMCSDSWQHELKSFTFLRSFKLAKLACLLLVAGRAQLNCLGRKVRAESCEKVWADRIAGQSHMLFPQLQTYYTPLYGGKTCDNVTSRVYLGDVHHLRNKTYQAIYGIFTYSILLPGLITVQSTIPKMTISVITIHPACRWLRNS